VFEVTDPMSLVQIERRILRPTTPPQTRPVQPPSPGSTRLEGVLGRIQAVLERKGQAILYGPPGTGKTFWAQTAAHKLSQIHGGSESSDSVRTCTFHPSYGYEDFLEGYRPVVIGEQLVFKRQDGILERSA
jgi:5-methylcytosine-specific restriction protein B